MAAWIVAQLAGRNAAIWAFVLVLLQPLGPELALNLLSDEAGSCVLLFIALLPEDMTVSRTRSRALIAGLVLGWALACRPTNLIMVLAAALAQ